MTSNLVEMDEFDVLLNDVLRSVANPDLPERVRVNVQTRVWVREMGRAHGPRPQAREMGQRTLRPAVVFSPAAFQQRMNARRDTRSTVTAVLVHAAAIAMVFWLVAAKVKFTVPDKVTAVTEIQTPPPMKPAKDVMGGGGGQRGPTPVTKGQMPKFAETQITPPKAPPLEQPKIRMPDPTIEVQTDLKMANNNMPNLGMPNSPLMGASMGNGKGSGLGGGNGSGLGNGTGGGFGGGLRHIGGGVSAPVLTYSVEPEFSEEARKAKAAGNVLVGLIVDQNGKPQNVHLVRGVGMGLDEKALEAVRQYRFRPAMEAGKPVAVELNVEVNFQIF